MIVIAGWLGVTMLPVGGTVFAATCQDQLVDETFTCEFIDQGGGPGTETWQFTAPGTLGDFDLTVTDTGQTRGCSCQARGTFRDPEFDQNRAEFLCGLPAGDIAEAMSGRVTLFGEISAENVQFGGSTPGVSTLFRCRKS